MRERTTSPYEFQRSPLSNIDNIIDDCKSFPLDVDPGEAKKMVRAIADTHIKYVISREYICKHKKAGSQMAAGL